MMPKLSYGPIVVLLLAFCQIDPTLSQSNQTVSQTDQTEERIAALRTFAIQSGIIAADEEDDYTCTESKGCEIGCCGAL